MKHTSIAKRSLAVLLCLAMCISSFCMLTVGSAAAEEEDVVSKIYPVTDDAYVREENSGTAYPNDETLSSSHGAQFADGQTKVVNVKYDTGNPKRNIRSLFKFDLPTKAEAAEKSFDTYELVINIARIADPNTGTQTYGFYYVTDLVWSESTVTWNEVNESLAASDSNLLFDFVVEQGTDYSALPEEERSVRFNVSEKLEALIEGGVQTVTVFIAAKNSMNTTLQIHTKDSKDGSLGASVVASSVGYTKDTLGDLIDECGDVLAQGAYSKDSAANLRAAIDSANAVKADSAATYNGIRAAYIALVYAKNALADASQDYLVTKDAYIRQENSGSNYNSEAKDGYNLLNSKYWTGNNARNIVGLMQFGLPTKAEVSENSFDTFEFTFNIYKNPDPQNGPQTYYFYYVTDLAWDETTVTWDSINASIPESQDKVFFEFVVEDELDYGTITDSDKKITVDVTDKVKALIADGASSVTLFMVAKDSLNTSLQIHSRESKNGVYTAKLTASYSGYDQDMLKELIDECDAISADGYTADSFAALQSALTAAKAVNGADSASVQQIKDAYNALIDAKEALVIDEGNDDDVDDPATGDAVAAIIAVAMLSLTALAVTSKKRYNVK